MTFTKRHGWIFIIKINHSFYHSFPFNFFTGKVTPKVNEKQPTMAKKRPYTPHDNEKRRKREDESIEDNEQKQFRKRITF